MLPFYAKQIGNWHRTDTTTYGQLGGMRVYWGSLLLLLFITHWWRGSAEVKVSHFLQAVSRQAGGAPLISAEGAVMDGCGQKTRSRDVFSQ